MDPAFIVSLACLGSVVGFAIYGIPRELVVHAAIATSMATIVFTSVSSMRAHHKRGAILWNIVLVMAPGMIVGGLLSGGAVFSYLSGVWLSIIFAVFVGYSGFRMLNGKPPAASRRMPGTPVTAGVGVGIGFASGLLGAGGGFLSVPFMTRSNISVHNAVATSAALGFFIAVANSAGYIYSGFNEVGGQEGMLGYIYWPALVVLSAMSMLTAPYGARCAHRLPVATLKRVFACLLFGLAVYMLYEAYIGYTS